MSGLKRKMLINYKATEKRVSLGRVYRELIGRSHRHVCSNPSCRLSYEDSCFAPEQNGRCHFCRGHRRPWQEPGGRIALDPRPCCEGNTALMTEPEDLLRYQCVGPGPWFQCQTCFRTHGHSCTDPDLLTRPLVASNQEGRS